ncbi:MAG: sulfatase [Bacteroidota bacterium]|nr:sulfatase [Bacteroidota bacterium]
MNKLSTSCLLLLPFFGFKAVTKEYQRPNILVCVADDQSYPHTSAYGCKWVKTPGFDQVAHEGILFTNAFTPNAKCAPSRSCILTGRNPWQLEAAANHVPYFPAKFKTYAETLIDNGYHVGYTAKGWAPGVPGMKNGQIRELLGPAYNEIKTDPPTTFISPIDYAANFEAFLNANKDGKPFCFWFGSHEPHRPYEFQSGIKKGREQLSIFDKVFDFWPDNDTVRTDLQDYTFEIEYFDSHLQKMLRILKVKGLLENTIIIVTADNGMPFPRIKGNAYILSNHLPLAIMWPKGIKNPGRVFSGFVSLTDIAPTILNLAGIDTSKSGMQPMEGKSLVPIFSETQKGEFRDFMIIGKERTDLGRPDDKGYPIRGIVNGNFLYLRNYEPEHWPAGNPETGYMDCDGSPTKSFILNERRSKGKSTYWDLNFGKHPGEELYLINMDQECINNLAENSKYIRVKDKLIKLMEQKLRKDKDPRILGNGAIFETYPYSDDNLRNFYNRLMSGERLKADWINQTDIEKAKLY